MPYSVMHGKQIISDWIKKQKDILTIVDIGPGYATYPKILGLKYKYKAVEIWAPYIRQFELNKIYEEIRIGDIRYTEFPKGDCVIFGDILEHMTKEDARGVIHRAEESFRHIIISIPIGHCAVDRLWENPFEEHQSVWSFKELCDIFHDYEIKEQVKSMAIFCK